MFLPVAYLIKKNYPSTTIHFFSNRANRAAELVKHSSYVDKVIEYDFSTYTILHYFKFYATQFLLLVKRLKGYDYILTIVPNPLRKSLLAATKTPKMVNNNKKVHQIQACVDLLKPFDIQTKLIYDSLLAIPNENKILKRFHLKKKDYLLFNLHANHPEYKQLLETLAKRHYVVLIGQEKKPCYIKNVQNLTNKTTITEAAAIVKNARLFISIEGGLMHVAIAQNVPTIGIFGPVHSSFRRPINSNYTYFHAIDLENRRTSYEKRKKKKQAYPYAKKIDFTTLNQIIENAVTKN